MGGWSLPMFLASEVRCDVAEVHLLRRSDVDGTNLRGVRRAGRRGAGVDGRDQRFSCRVGGSWVTAVVLTARPVERVRAGR